MFQIGVGTRHNSFSRNGTDCYIVLRFVCFVLSILLEREGADLEVLIRVKMEIRSW